MRSLNQSKLKIYTDASTDPGVEVCYRSVRDKCYEGSVLNTLLAAHACATKDTKSIETHPI